MGSDVDDDEVDDGWTPESDAAIARGYHRVHDPRGGYIEELPVLVRQRRFGKDVTELVTLRLAVRDGKRARSIDAKKDS